MKVITRDTDYAIRALCCIAKHKGNVVSAAELVRSLEVPRPFLRKILQTLGKKRIVTSYKGKGGGFSLSVLPGKLSLYDIAIAFQGPLRLNDHILRKRVCPHTKTCLTKSKFDNIEKMMIRELKAVTLACLI